MMYDEEDDDTHDHLITSEQRRLHLEQELKKMMSRSNKSERLQEIQLRTQMENLKSQRQRSMERNQMIRRQMQEFEINLSTVTAKTQRLRTLKEEYEEYIERLYPRWKEQVLAKAAELREKEARRHAMTRDIGLTEELSVPDLTRSQSEGFSPHHSLPGDNTINVIPPTTNLSSSSSSFGLNVRDQSHYSPRASSSPHHIMYPHMCPHTASAKLSHLTQGHHYTVHDHSDLGAIDLPIHPLSAENGRHVTGAQQTTRSDTCITSGSSRHVSPPLSTSHDRIIFLPTALFNVITSRSPSISVQDSNSDIISGSGISHPGYYDHQSHPVNRPPSGYQNGSGDYQHYQQSPNGSLHRSQTSHDQSYPTPDRSSTPDHHASRPDRGIVSTSLQSLHSEKSVTFDESSLRRELGPSHSLTHSPPSPRDTAANHSTRQRSSPRRQTPSPSELIRMSMSSRESSRHSSQASLLDFDNKQPGQSQRVPPSTSQSQPSYDLTVQSQSTYPDFSQAQADIGRPPISQPSTSQYNTGLSTYNKSTTEPIYAEVHKQQPQSAIHDTQESHKSQNQERQATSPSHMPADGYQSEQRRFSCPQVVIPSTEDIADDMESITEQQSADVHMMAEREPSRDVTDIASANPQALYSQTKPQEHIPEVRHSISSLNMTTEEPQPAVDITKTAEFRSLLTGTMTSTKNADGDSDDDSVDSMEAVENAYRQVALSKTNTMALGQDLKPPPADLLPSSDEEEGEDNSDSDEMSQPMGYTPSFKQSGVTSPRTAIDSTGAATGQSTKSAGNNTGGLSTAGSKNSSQSSRKPVFSRTESDVESESDLLPIESPDKKRGSANSDVEDDFDFYG